MNIASEKKNRRFLLRLTAHFNNEIVKRRFGTLDVGLIGGDLLLDLSEGMSIEHHLYGALAQKVEITTVDGAKITFKNGRKKVSGLIDKGGIVSYET
jgi:hypothetical protein